MQTKKRSWSLSTLNLYEQCPLKYKFVKIDKREERASIHLQRGIAAHHQAEQYLLGKLSNVPVVLSKFHKEMQNLLKHGAIPEEQIVFNNKWEEIPGDSWMHSDAWLRMKLDARIGNYLVDFKTGKHYEEHASQAKLYANAHLLRTTDDEVDVEFWYLSSGDVKSYTFHRKDLDKDIDQWNQRVKTLMEDETFTARKHEWCKYCDFKKECPEYARKSS